MLIMKFIHGWETISENVSFYRGQCPRCSDTIELCKNKKSSVGTGILDGPKS